MCKALFVDISRKHHNVRNGFWSWGGGCVWVGGVCTIEDEKRKRSPATENSNNSAFVSILIPW